MDSNININNKDNLKALIGEADSVVVRLAGDSGDGIQLLGGLFGLANAVGGSGIKTFPDFPSEIRAPVGTTYGVSAFQIHFGSRKILTIGDDVDVLVALNPAALKVNIPYLKPNSIVIVDGDTFKARNLAKAGYDTDPREGDELDGYNLVDVSISKFTSNALAESDLSKKETLRCRNFWVLGLICWLFNLDRKVVHEWIEGHFSNNEAVLNGNNVALNAGYSYGDTIELQIGNIHPFSIGVNKAAEAGTYRSISGSEAIAWGLIAGSELASRKLFFASYPITPASPILHHLSKLIDLGIITFQAEDEIAAVCSAIGASFAGNIGITSSSGPGIALKMEAVGLAISVELPLVILNTQRAGPSTGMPTKTEQSDLLQAVYGRNSDSNIPVLAARSPNDGFYTAIEAMRLAIEFMTPVMLLSDSYIGNASEPWKIEDVGSLPKINKPNFSDAENFKPFARDEQTLSRPWVQAGTEGLRHRIGGLEKLNITGEISYDPDNHQKMTDLRYQKIENISNFIPDIQIEQGNDKGKLLILGWGSTFGPISRAVHNLRLRGVDVSNAQLRYINPFPRNLAQLLSHFDKVLIPEMNMGQLATLLKAKDCGNIKSLCKVSGLPFLIREIEEAIENFDDI